MKRSDVVSALGIPSGASAYIPSHGLIASDVHRTALEHAGVSVQTELREAPIDVAVLDAPTSSFGAADAQLPRILHRLALGGQVVFVDCADGGAAAFPSWTGARMSMHEPLSARVAAAAWSVGLEVAGKAARAGSYEVLACTRPAEAPKPLRSLARKLPNGGRVGLFGAPLHALAALQTLFGLGVASSYEPGRGKLDLILFFTDSWRDPDIPELRKRVAPGGRLMVVFSNDRYKPPTVTTCVEPYGFAGTGKAEPFPLWEGLRSMSFEPREGPRKRVRPLFPAAPKRPKKKAPARRPKPSTDEIDPRTAAAEALARPVATMRVVRERKKCTTSTLGPVTWARDDEAWPTDRRGRPLVHRVTVRVDELPFSSEQLDGVALFAVFVGADAGDAYVRSYPTVEGLVRRTAPVSERPPTFFDRKPSELMHGVVWEEHSERPPMSVAHARIPARLRPKSIEDTADLFEEIGIEHRRETKIGGWPTVEKSGTGYVMQLEPEYEDSGEPYMVLHRRRGRWQIQWAERAEDPR